MAQGFTRTFQDGNYGDITVSGVTTVWTINNGVVTFAKMQNINNNVLLGNASGGAGPVTEITLDSTLEFNAGNLRRAALTGDVTASAGSNATTIANSAVTFAKMQNINTQTVIGRGTAGAGAPESITLASSLSITAGSLGVVADTTRQLTKVIANAVDVGSRSQMHYSDSASTGIGWRITDDAGNSEIDLSTETGSWSVLGNITVDNIALSTTSYWALIGGQITDNTTESNRIVYLPFKGEFKNLYIRTYGSQSATGSLVITLRVNSVDTAITVTIAAGSVAGSYSDTANTATNTQGQSVSLKAVNNATANSATCGWMIGWKPTT